MENGPFVNEIGDGLPLVALHGLNVDNASMQALLEPRFEHRSGWRRLYLDLPGHGQTPGTDPPSADAMLDSVADAVEQSLGGEPFALVGASLGAYLAFALLDRYPGRVTGIAAVVPVIEPDDDLRETPEMRKTRTDDTLFAGLPDELVPALRSLMSHETAAAVTGFAESHLPAFARSDQRYIARLRTGAYALTSPPTFAYDGPGLVVTGRQDTAVGFEQALAVRDRLTATTFVALDGAGHVAELERPGVVAALFDDWLDRVEQSL